MIKINTIFSFFRQKREDLIANYLNKNIMEKGSFQYYWQPPLFVLFKLIFLIIILIKIYSFYPLIGDSIEKGFKFFKLSKIFNFKFPGKNFFYTISKGLIIILFGLHGISFLLMQFQALLSSVILNRSEKKLYYIKTGFLKKEIYIFSLYDIETVILKQRFILKQLLNVGTIRFKTKNGDEVNIQSIYDARILAAQMVTGH